VQLLPFCMGYFYPWADEIVAVSKGVADDLALRAHVSRERITVIYNPAINGDFFERAQEPVQHPWFSPTKPPVILAVGRLATEKGFDVLIRAFARVRAQRLAKLMILGEGDQRPYLEALSRELRVEEDVCLAGYEENPYAYMARAQIFVLASHYEGFGLVLVEALALKLPIISTDCESGPREILQNGRYGDLVPVGSVESLAGAILSKLDRGKQSVPGGWLKNFETSTSLDAYETLICQRMQCENTVHPVAQKEVYDL
jgi:glycosyltransferase involved in cell wall biosynthesis